MTATTAQDLLAAAVRERDLGRYDRAIEILMGLLMRNPANPTGFALLAEVMSQAKQDESAENALLAALDMRRDSPRVQRARARLRLRQGRTAEALEAAQASVEADPSDPEARLVLAAALNAAGRAAEAAPLLEAIIAERPDMAEAYASRALIRGRAGDRAGALQDAEAAVRLKPHLAPSWRLLGSLRYQGGDLAGAIDAVQEATRRDPTETAYLLNLAELHRERGDAASALATLDIARAEILAAPTPAKLNLLAAAFLDLGRRSPALEAAVESLTAGDTPEGRSLFVQAIRNMALTDAAPNVRAFLRRAIAEAWGRTTALAGPALMLVRSDPTVADVIRRAVEAWPARPGAAQLYGADGLAALEGDGLLAEVLTVDPVADVAFEQFLTAARHALLEMAQAGSEDPAPGFHAALAAQAFINEYVWGLAPGEAEAAHALGRRLAQTLAAGDRPAPALLVAVAAYGPLHRVAGAERLLDLDWSEPVARLLDLQLRGPAADAAAAAGVPRLTPIDDQVSQAVQAQYEDNPYPRWTRAPGATPPLPVDRVMRLTLPRAPLQPVPGGASPDVLIAGCGTGRQAITAARRYPAPRILAVDLSLTSLAYATRKTAELGVDNVEYAQADLLELEGLGRTFDVIECGGVLHHLADPAEGLRRLVRLLRPGGVLALGLYSELARRDLAPARELARGFGAPTAEAIRAFRQAVIAAPAGDPVRTVLDRGDFYTVSGCRDLLFHVQETCFTTAEIAGLLAQNDLTFLGFGVTPEVLAEYRRENPQDARGVDLAGWGAFEARHPETFVGMYQLWAQKPA